MGVQTRQPVKCIYLISVWNCIQIYFSSVIFGFILTCKLLGRWALHPKTFFSQQKRDKPPAFLVNNSLGQHSYLKLNGVKLHYVESGKMNKPLIVMLHGFPDCWIGWRHQIPVLSNYFRVVALDLKGFGDSDKPFHRRSYRVNSVLNELYEFIDSLGASSCVIIGHDIGGLLGWLLAYTYPGLVKKFIALSCPHPNIYWDALPHQGLFNSRWVNVCQLPYLPEVDALKNEVSMITETYTHINSYGSKEKTNTLSAYKYSFSRRDDWTGPINYYRNLPFIRVSLSSEKNENSWDQESWKGGKVLFIAGDQDKLISLGSVIRSKALLPSDVSAEIEVVTGAGHFPHQEKPNEVNRYILDFLEVSQTSSEKEKPVAFTNRWVNLSSLVHW